MQSTGYIEIYAQGTSKDLVCRKTKSNVTIWYNITKISNFDYKTNEDIKEQI